MSYLKLTFYWLVVQFFALQHQFEGTVHYTVSLNDKYGNAKPFSWFGSRFIYYGDSLIISSDGFDKDIQDKLIVAKGAKLYEIDYKAEKLKLLDKRTLRNIELLEEKALADTTLLGYSCKVYKHQHIRINNSLPLDAEHHIDTVNQVYYVASDLNIPNQRELAAAQGHNNTLLFDGRYNSLILRVEEYFNNGDKLTITATKIEFDTKKDYQKILVYKH